MDVYQMLMQDHCIVEQIFVEVQQTDDREVERREQLFEKLRAALEEHTVVEENVFYPKIDKYAAIKELVADAFDEHAEFEQTLQQISELPPIKPTGWKESKSLRRWCRNTCTRRRIRCRLKR